MKRINRTGGLALILALALCACLLAGCGSTADKAAEPAETEETAAVQEPAETTEAENTEAVEEGDPGFDAPALIDALNGVCSVGPGSSGCSLRAAKAAGELVAFAALNWRDDSAKAITDAIGGWFEELSEDAKEEFHLGWDMVEDTVGDIVARPGDPEIEGLLESAGLPNLGLSAMDLTHTDALLEAIRSQTGDVSETD